MERHDTDPVSLVFGLLFVAVAAVGLIGQLQLDAADLRWIAPGLLVVLGVLLVLPIGRSSTPEVRRGQAEVQGDLTTDGREHTADRGRTADTDEGAATSAEPPDEVTEELPPTDE